MGVLHGSVEGISQRMGTDFVRTRGESTGLESRRMRTGRGCRISKGKIFFSLLRQAVVGRSRCHEPVMDNKVEGAFLSDLNIYDNKTRLTRMIVLVCSDLTASQSWR